ncbi:MAG: acyl dehydratase [Glaciihabitans sp.]|nr:acyl dehydratase [Glaciihabitans sp.]
MTTTITYDRIADLAGRDLGFTEYREISQERVNTFADATDDHQYIHIDPELAKAGPFGKTVAHGFLTLSMTVPLWTELLEVDGVGAIVNYGLDKVRFVTPVTAGSRIRMGAAVAEVSEVTGGWQLAVNETVEIEGGTKPAVIARALIRYYA